MRQGLVSGVNVDKINVSAGLRELAACGWPMDGSNVETYMVIQYALQRWARGEETAALRGAIDKSFHGIPITCWYRVLAAARVGAELASVK
jgi:hypothetical protein